MCLESKKKSEEVELPCSCCDECLFQYIQTQITSANVTELKCFIKSCNYVLSEEFIISRIKKYKVLLDKYRHYKQRSEVFHSKDKTFCPEPDCDSYLQWKQGQNKYVKCENGHEYCYICLRHWHGDKKCKEEKDKGFEKWMKNKVIKECPRCKIKTQKMKDATI